MELTRRASDFMMRSMLADQPYSEVVNTQGESAMREEMMTFSTLSPKTSFMSFVSGSNSAFSSSIFFLTITICFKQPNVLTVKKIKRKTHIGQKHPMKAIAINHQQTRYGKFTTKKEFTSTTGHLFVLIINVKTSILYQLKRLTPDVLRRSHDSTPFIRRFTKSSIFITVIDILPSGAIPTVLLMMYYFQPPIPWLSYL